jgi:raffinose/stachyose/melibiose transport system permease protein
VNHKINRYVRGWVAIGITAVIFLVPFAFIILQSMKNQEESSRLEFSFPSTIHFFENVAATFQARDYMLVRALFNSTIITVASVTAMVIMSAMIGWVLARRKSRLGTVMGFFVIAGLIVPPAVVPTIWVLQKVLLFKTIPGIVLVEIAYGMAFCILLFRAFVSTIPRELDEAAILDGAGPVRLFFEVAFPLLRGVIVTAVVVQSVAVFNDFANPLYFLPGDENATVQVTLYNFQSQFLTQFHLLFTDILLITVPPLLMYIFFNRQIVAGMTSGAVKG